MLGHSPLSANALSAFGRAQQSAAITGDGGLEASGAATANRGTKRTAAGGLQATGAAATYRGRKLVASGGLRITGTRPWLVDLARQVRPRYERRHLVPPSETRTATPRYESRRIAATETR